MNGRVRNEWINEWMRNEWMNYVVVYWFLKFREFSILHQAQNGTKVCVSQWMHRPETKDDFWKQRKKWGRLTSKSFQFFDTLVILLVMKRNDDQRDWHVYCLNHTRLFKIIPTVLEKRTRNIRLKRISENYPAF